ncbi:TPA_asm: hypothetical protein GIN74_01140 [Listeria monocytogenes]|uniref:hypothetical protein n=1 Tax=Listeria monocytogenes TaxID=1639 RepID=UPI000A1D4CF4|nr:hypothetical protein [Listeria monocytogenes]ARM74522.1 hypothetical protein LMxysn_2887 [Listeria monocytogenes]HAB0008040.1 hypothetical protein [Listeria monocytogenes]
MDKRRELMLKMENLDDTFYRKKRQLEESMDEATQAKWQFNRELEHLSEQVRYIYQKREYGDSRDFEKAYHLISSIQDETEWDVKNVLRKLEDEHEEQHAIYKKQSFSYEEELHQIKKESDR